MAEHGRLLALVRRFLDAKDECCLANLLDDAPPEDLTRLISDLGTDQRAVILRLLASRRDPGRRRCPSSSSDRLQRPVTA